MSFSSAHVTTLRHHPTLDHVPDAVVADIDDASVLDITRFREDLARRGVPLFMLMRRSSLRRSRRDRDDKAEVFVLDREQALAEAVALVRGVVSYVEMRTRSDRSDPVVPGL
ncbi:MAG: hypothetical protein KY455_07680 [Euryarchaeota archaeon]|nr:hypothetical protein [Euryarchaeota archaeon]